MEKVRILSRTKELLILFGLEDNLNDKVGRFSKGMKQRLALAQAVLHRPNILILDEPTDGLDPQGIVDMREILLGLKRDGHTILMSSHLLTEVQDTCDRIIMIDRGKMIAHESMDNVARYARTRCYDITLAEDLLAGALEGMKRIEGVRTVESLSARRLLVELDSTTQGGDWLLKEIMSRGLRVEAFRPHSLPLESYYVQKRKEAG